MNLFAEIYTITVTNTTFDIPDGMTEIFFNNIGAGDASFKGSYTDSITGAPSTSVTIPKGQAFSLGFVGRARKGFQLDATGTVVEVSITN